MMQKQLDHQLWRFLESLLLLLLLFSNLSRKLNRAEYDAAYKVLVPRYALRDSWDEWVIIMP